jgi:flagellar hook-associated protein 3 FlgL
MISSLRPSTQQFLNNLNGLNDRMQRAQRQISTGVRMARVSDDPDKVSTLLQVRSNLDSAQRIQSNLGLVKGEVDAGEQTLESAVQLFEQARTLGAQGATGTQTAAERAGLAQQVGSILEQMVGLASTSAQGRFIFSGDSDQQAPYTVDLTQAVPVSAYLGTAATRLAQHPNGTTFSVSHTAQEIFDSADPTTNVFGALVSLRAALLSNNDTTIRTVENGLTKVGEYFNSQLSFYGITQNKVSEANDFGQNLQVQLQAQISGLQDADLTSAILEMNQVQTEQQASLQAEARIPRSTLFDYLA